MRWAPAALALALGCQRPPARGPDDAGDAAQAPAATLRFRVEQGPARSLTLAALEAEVGAETVAQYDPYYGRLKRFRALRLDRVLRVGFAGRGELARQQFVLRARDGYTVPLSGARLFEGGAYLAVRDLDRPGWEPIGPQRADPGPLYLIWSRPEQTSLETHPRPWQLAEIEIARVETVFPHTAPPAGVVPAVTEGYALFVDRCLRCHAINREGGRVGPELNVPQNITQYRPEAQIRAYIRNPLQFRYGNMPSHPDLTEADLDHLVAYLRVMADHRFDPTPRPDGGPAL